jgi:hypothetical protein
MPTDFLSLFAVMNAAQVPYVEVGGLAMLLHGIDRVTGDIDVERLRVLQQRGRPS